MDLREAEILVDELAELIDAGPGMNPEGLRRVGEICWQFRNAERCDHLLAEKLHDARTMFGYWFSVRGWQQWGADGDGARVILGNDVENVRLAVVACFGEKPGNGVMA